MVIPDANLLIYSYQTKTSQHKAALAWLEKTFSGSDTIGLTWITLWAFIRINSNPRVWRNQASSVSELFDRIDEWQEQSNVVLVNPGPRHKQILRSLMVESGAVGNLASDAVLAAIAIEHAATLASTDRYFRHFSGLRWVNPLD